jgi:hypothetical protein
MTDNTYPARMPFPGSPAEKPKTIKEILEADEKEKSKTKKRFESLASKDLRSQTADFTWWLTVIVGLISIIILGVCVVFLVYIWTSESFKDLPEKSQDYLRITFGGVSLTIIIIIIMWIIYRRHLYPKLKIEDQFLTSYARLSTVKGSLEGVKNSLGNYLNSKLGGEGYYTGENNEQEIRRFGRMLNSDNLFAFQNAEESLPSDIYYNGNRTFHNARGVMANLPQNIRQEEYNNTAENIYARLGPRNPAYESGNTRTDWTDNLPRNPAYESGNTRTDWTDNLPRNPAYESVADRPLPPIPRLEG